MSREGDEDLIEVVSPLLCVKFNADGSCVSFATRKDFSVYNTRPVTQRVKKSFQGGLRVVHLHYNSSLVALVPSGEVSGFSPRKVLLYDCAKGQLLKELSFPLTVCDCLINHTHLVAVLQDRVVIYDLATLSSVAVVDIAKDCTAGVSLCTGDKSLLTIPKADGHIQVLQCYERELKEVFEVQAHKSSLRIAAISRSGALLATCSETGTIVRVFRVSSTEPNKEFGSYRRGFQKSDIISMSISPGDDLLVVGSASGTVHIFSLRETSAAISATVSDKLRSSSVEVPSEGFFASSLQFLHNVTANVTRLSSEVKDVIDYSRAQYLIRVPAGEKSFQAIVTSDSSSGAVSVFVVTLGGYLYRFGLPPSAREDSQPLNCILEDEYNLLDS